jgi:hypothetical protein
MILKSDKAIRLHLESICSNNLVHFQPERRKSHWTGMVFDIDWSRKRETENLNLTHAWVEVHRPNKAVLVQGTLVEGEGLVQLISSLWQLAL